MSIAEAAARLGLPLTPLVSAVDDPPATIDLGWSVHEQTPADSDYWPRGGTLAAVIPGGAANPDTGEVVDRYRLVRVVEGRLAWVSLRSDQVATPQRPNASTIRGLCQVVARELARDHREPDDAKALELWSLGARLMSVIGAPGSVAP